MRTVMFTLTVLCLLVPSRAVLGQSSCPSGGCPRYPDTKLTPGATRATTKSQICTGSTKTVRDVPPALKNQVFTEYHLSPAHTNALIESLSAPGVAPPRGAVMAEVSGPKLDPTVPGKPGPHGAEFEIDHFVPLELGGSNDISNLWPESYVMPWGAHIKDEVEDRLKALVCAGTLTLAEAQTAIRTDWIAAYHKYVATSGKALK